MSKRRSAIASVQVVLEIETGSWGPDCTMGQVTSQARESALARVKQLLREPRDPGHDDPIVSALVTCGCSDPTCPRMVCPVCRCEDCKWAGGCRGKCIECGAPAEPMPGCTDIFTCHCSPACMAASTARWEADGSLVAVGDMTPERLNEMLGDVGLALEGVLREEGGS